MSQRQIFSIMAVMLFAATGCHKEEAPKQEVPAQEAVPEVAQNGQEAAQNGQEAAQNGQEAAQNGQEAAQNGVQAEAPVANPVAEANVEMKTCEGLSMSAADAEQWECVPGRGFWCQSPDGCAYQGSKFKAGMHFKDALPLPQGEGYLYKGRVSAYEDREVASVTGGWKCNLDDGCLCGTEKVAKSAICYGNMYAAKDALSGTCNKDNCNAFCQDGKCMCGEYPILSGVYESFGCYLDINVCLALEGCKSEDKLHALDETWFDFRMPYSRCTQKQGCPCGKNTCKYGENCQYGECDGTIDENDQAENNSIEVPEGYTLEDGKLVCGNANGCKCGSQLCSEGLICRDDLCVDEAGGSVEEEVIVFYCDKPEGCACGTKNALCAQGSLCEMKFANPDYTSDSQVFKCQKISDKYKDSKALFELFKNKEYNEILNPSDGSAGKNIKDISFAEEYFSGEDVINAKNYYIQFKDGKRYDMFVLCSKAGCDCNGTPLKDGYICAEQHIIFDTADAVGDYFVCPKPFVDYAHEGESSKCELYDNIIEQVCFNPNGCACGEGVIQTGDVCVNGQGRCGTKAVRSGCVCGDTQITDTNYGCYHDKVICQAETCSCNNKTIHQGDVCEKDKVICGENSGTEGCLCGETALRKGYRCYNHQQRCSCESVSNDETDEENENDENAPSCTCSCGTSKIEYDEICLDDNSPLVRKKLEYEIKHDDILMTCGDKTVVMPSAEMYSKDGYELHIDDPDNIDIYCTCGTGKPAPGEGYRCGLEPYKIGSHSEWAIASAFKGWQCLKPEGCGCGSQTCQPGDICNIAKDGSKTCEAYKTFKGQCDRHYLPPTLVFNEGYGCYDEYSGTSASGWYCNKAEGCACGDVKCEYLQSCLVPGYCGKNKLTEKEGSKLQPPEIKSGELS